MKMEHVIKSPDNGKIAKINYKVGDTVGEGRTLLELEGDAEEVKKPDEE